LKTFLDEGVPEGLEPYLAGREVSTVKRKGWNSIKNGKLLALIEKSGFDHHKRQADGARATA
jgi:hypothetical protein